MGDACGYWYIFFPLYYFSITTWETECIFTTGSGEYILQSQAPNIEKEKNPKIPGLEKNQRRGFGVFLLLFFIFYFKQALGVNWVLFNCSAVYGFRKRCSEHYQFNRKQMEIGCEKYCAQQTNGLQSVKKTLRNSTFVSSSVIHIVWFIYSTVYTL